MADDNTHEGDVQPKNDNFVDATEDVAFSMRETGDVGGSSVEGVTEETQSLADESVLAELEEDLEISDENLDEDKEGVFAELQGILAELHLTPKQVLQLLFFFVILVGLVIFSFVYLGNFLNENGTGNVPENDRQFDTTVIDLTNNRVNDEVVVVDPKPVEKDVDDGEPGFFDKFFGIFTGDEGVETPVVNDEVVSDPDVIEDPIVAPIPDIVMDNVQVDVKVFARKILFNVVILGSDEELDSSLSYYSRTYRRVRNIFNTDLFAYLENFSDRNEAFNDFMGDFRASYAESLFAFEELRQETERLQETVIRLEREQAFAEQLYLDAQEDLASENLPDLLFDYQTVASRYTVARSEYKARELLFVRFEGTLSIIDRKIQAFEANEEAFVKGVQIIDFPDLDLDLIVPFE